MAMVTVIRSPHGKFSTSPSTQSPIRTPRDKFSTLLVFCMPLSFPQCYQKMVMKNCENKDKITHHHFFKIVHPDQLTTQHLRIPSKFKKHISRKPYTQGVILEGPSGRHWHAKLCRTRDGTYIREGWQKFVTDHSLWDNAFLVFRYDGNVCFNIQIFNKNGCEREKIHTTSSERHQDPIVEKRKPGRPPKRKFVSNSSQKQGTPENISASYFANERAGPAKKKVVSRPRKEPATPPKKNASLEEPPPSTDCKGNLEQKIKTEDEDDSLPIYGRDTKSTHCLSRRQTQTDEEAKLWKAVESFSSSRPCFIRHLKTSTPWKTLYIPAGFSKAHFPRHHINIILRNQQGNAWTVKVCYINTRYNLCGGWPNFVHANKLEGGEICVFELVGELEFCVHISHLVKEATSFVL